MAETQNYASQQITTEDYDAAYLAQQYNAGSNIGENADLPLYFTVQTSAKIVTSADLISRCSLYMPKAEVAMVRDAFRYADEAHLGQFRKSGEPYITHPLAVANILARWHLDCKTVCAGLMHDVIEDTGTTKIELAERFGIDVAELVDGVSKLDRIKYGSVEIAQAESFRKMLLAMGKDVRVILIKLADRLHNMRTLGVMRPEKRRRIATETLEIYVPIAHRLGLNQLYRELKELAFLNQHPLRYRILKENVFKTRDKRRQILENIYKETKAALPKSHISARIIGRDRTIYGIYNRMRETKSSFSDAMDIYGFRIIVRTLEDCYLTLCALHKLYKPVHHRFKDFIAIPKSNGYQSLHTTVIGPAGTPIEFQIRTEQMHRIAENGLLAHWLYHDGMDTSGIQDIVTRWIDSLIDIQKSSSNSTEFVENIKIDLFPNHIYVFTPKSKIITMPEGSTPIDFAYQIHTQLGNHLCGCRINGDEATPDKVLQNGDTIEIITDDLAYPDPEWIRVARTGKARAKIRQILRERTNQEAIAIGKKSLDNMIARLKIRIRNATPDLWESLASSFGFDNLQGLYLEIGRTQLSSVDVAYRLRDAIRRL